MTRTQQEALRYLKSVSSLLTVQQYRTIKGQVLSGHTTAAMRGLDRVLTSKERGGHTI